MRMKFISKGDGASVELSYYLCVWIVEKEREGHSRQSRQNDHRHRYKHNPCVSIIRGAWIPTSPVLGAHDIIGTTVGLEQSQMLNVSA